MGPRRTTRGGTLETVEITARVNALSVEASKSSVKNGATESGTDPLPKPKTVKKRGSKLVSETSVDTVGTDASIARTRSQGGYLNALPVPPKASRPAAQLFVWGAGNDGQFGTGPSDGELFTERRSPYRSKWFEEKVGEGVFGKESGAGAETIAAGGLHSMFVDENGTVWSFGNNDEAALGRETAQVKGEGQNLSEEELTAFPHPVQTLVEEGFRAVRIAAGDNICGAISSEGELRVWGTFRANEGALGFSSEKKQQALPASILTLPNKGGEAEKAAGLAAGTNHMLVLTTHGRVYAWGAGDAAQLGRRVLERRKIHGTVPERVVLGSRGRLAVGIASGSYHSFAVDTEGVVWGWGANHLGQTGTGAGEDEVRSPKRVNGLGGNGERVVQIAGGEHHTLFLTSLGRVFACGRAYNGQLGLDVNEDCVREPVLVDKFQDLIVKVAAGSHNSMAVSEGGALYAWGQGVSGELGAKEEEEVRTPREIVRKSGGQWKAVDVACGGQHTLGLFVKK